MYIHRQRHACAERGRDFRKGNSCVIANCQLARLNVPGNHGDKYSFLRSAWHPHQWIPHCCGSRAGCTGVRAALQQRRGGGIPPELGVRSMSSPVCLKGKVNVHRSIQCGTEPGVSGAGVWLPCRVMLPSVLGSRELRASAETVLNPVMVKVMARPNKYPF